MEEEEKDEHSRDTPGQVVKPLKPKALNFGTSRPLYQTAQFLKAFETGKA